MSRLAILPLLVAGCQMSPQRAAEEVARAQQMISEGRSVEAAELLQSVAAKRDDRPDVWLLLGRARMTLGQYPDAYVAYNNVIDLDRANREALAALAQLSLRSGDYAAAIKFGSQIQSLEPGDTLAQLVLAFAAIGQQRYVDANAIADALLSQDPTNASAHVVKSLVLDRKGDLHGALGALDPVKLSNSPDVMHQLRALYDKTADSTAQLPLLFQLIKVRPTDVSLRIALAKQFYLLGKLDRGTAILNSTLGSAHGDKSRRDVAAMWLDTGLDAAIIARSIDRTTNAAEVLKLAGAEFALTRKDPALALSLLRSKNIREPATLATADLLGAVALAQAMLGRTDQASALADQVLRVDKTQPKALAARARASLRRGLVNPAIRDARILIRDNPTTPDGYVLLADAYSRQGNQALSERVAEDGRAAMTNSIEFIEYYSDRLVARDQIADAAAILRDFTIRNPSSVAGWTVRRRTCSAMGDIACTKRASIILNRLAGKAVPFPPLPANEIQSDATLIDLT